MGLFLILFMSSEERWPSMEDAVAAAGSRPLAPEDPTRTQLIALAMLALGAGIVATRRAAPRPATA